MLFLILFTIIFGIFALLSTILKAIRENEITVQRNGLKKIPTGLLITIKILPELIALTVVILFMPSSNLFYLILAIALVFCLIGSIGMETKLIAGVILFLIAQFIFISNFIYHSAILGISFLPITALVTLFIAWVIVIIFLTQYIDSGETALGSTKPLILFYGLVVSFMSCSALLFWLTSDVPLGFIPFIGAICFVISDMLVGVKRFHHHFYKAQIIILLLYYPAIFLLSLSAVIYIFV
ncbi:MAG: lysoplasmalogenase family protein [Candidatus Thorarchaeota archaeon]